MILLQNAAAAHMRHPSPPHGVGQMSPHPMHGHMMPQMGQVLDDILFRLTFCSYTEFLMNCH